MRTLFLLATILSASAHLVHVGTSCSPYASCMADHKTDVREFFDEYPGNYEHIQTFVETSFITTTFYARGLRRCESNTNRETNAFTRPSPVSPSSQSIDHA